MVAPHPDLERKYKNTKKLVEENKSHFVPSKAKESPLDYVSLETYNMMKQKQPWIEDHLFTHRTTQKSSSSKKIIKSLGVPTDTDKLLIICVDFPDKPAQIPIPTIYDRYFSTTGYSLRNYYVENSYGKYTPSGYVYGWFRMPHNLTYYSDGKYGVGDYPNNYMGLFEDAINVAKSSIDWNSIDINNDNLIDHVAFVHAGAEAAATGNVNDMWALASSIGYSIGISSKIVNNGFVSAEYKYDSSNTQICGVDCHELAHCLGYVNINLSGNDRTDGVSIPDMYVLDIEHAVGHFSLMGYGSWGGLIIGGQIPTHLDPLSKKRLGVL